MIHAIIVSIIAIVFAFLARYRIFYYGLEVAFLIITIFLSIRYNWGSDYPNYLMKFHEYGTYNSFVTGFEKSYIEIGWILINKLFKPIGFFGMVIILTVFEQFVIYVFIKRNVPRNWYWFAIFIYTFNSSLMITGTSMMRQFLAMCIYIIAVDFIYKRKIFPFILLILLASTFHSSAIILLPTYFFSYINLNTTIKSLIWVTPLYLLWFFGISNIFGHSLFSLLLNIDLLEKYSIYLTQHDLFSGSGLGIAFFSVIFLVVISQLRYIKNDYVKLISLLFLIMIIIIPLSSFAPHLSRIGFYFSILSVACIPILLSHLKARNVRFVLMAGIIFFHIYKYIEFFYSSVWYNSFFIYHSIFESNKWL